MRKLFALLMALVLLSAIITVPTMAVQTPGNGGGGSGNIQNGGDNTGGGSGNDQNGGGNTGGGSSGPVVGEGQQKDFGNTDNGPEDNPEEDPEEKPEEDPEEKPEEDPEEKPEENPEENPEEKPEENLVEEPDPNTVLGDGQKQNVTETEPEAADAPNEDPTEMFLLVALITGLGAICVVLLIRRFLDL